MNFLCFDLWTKISELRSSSLPPHTGSEFNIASKRLVSRENLSNSFLGLLGELQKIEARDRKVDGVCHPTDASKTILPLPRGGTGAEGE